MEVPHLRITIKEDEIIEGARKLLPLLRPDWDLKLVRFKIFTDGITNKLLGCFNGSRDNDVMLIRVYGNKTDLLIDRKAETRNFKLLNAAGLAPRLYGTFEGGLVYEYVEGDVLTVETCHIDRIYILVAQTLADMHCIRTGEDASKKPILWGKIRQFLNLVPIKFSSSVKEARYKELFKENLNLEEEFSFLQDNLSTLDSPTVFCHNDLLLGNIIYNHNKDFVTFIDYEYADYNYQAYDIANHFNEYADVSPACQLLVSSLVSLYGNVWNVHYECTLTYGKTISSEYVEWNRKCVETVDYSLFPDYEYQIRWLRIYLERYYYNVSNGKGENAVSDEDIELLYNSVQKFTLASHFLWAVWALIQAENSAIDFDFINYAFIRFKEYFLRKQRIFNC